MSDALHHALAAIDSGSAPSVRVCKDLLRSIQRGDIPQERFRLEFKRAFSDDTRGWVHLIKDVMAIANFGGGLILFGVDNSGRCFGNKRDLSSVFDPANIANKTRNASQAMIGTSFLNLSYYRKFYGILSVLPSSRTFVFESDGGYQDDQGKSKKAFWKGVVYTRGAGGNLESNQSQFDAMMTRLVEERVRSFVAKIERVATLPPDTELIVRNPAVPHQGYALIERDIGIPVRIVDEDSREALRVQEVLVASVPFSSIDAEIIAQTRHWLQGDRAHRVQKQTLIRWYLNRHKLHLSAETSQFCFTSAGYEHGYPMYWSATMSAENLRETIEREIEMSRYPMRDILPYVVGLHFWDERESLLGQDGRRFSGNARNNARRVLTFDDRQRFLIGVRSVGATSVLDDRRVRLVDETIDRGNATALFEQILARDASGECPPSLRQVAHQLDIFLHAPENIEVDTGSDEVDDV